MMTTSATAMDERRSRLLVVRNDKLGDFMLAWPALACLKAADPALHVSVLVPAYTAPIARLCPWVDEVLLDPGDEAGADGRRELLTRLRQGRFDALLTLFSTPRIGWLGWRAGIPLRLAPATKWAQLFYNRRIAQRRSRSRKPEYVYNLELAEGLLGELARPLPPRPSPPFWPLPDGIRDTQRARIADELGLDEDRPWIFVHAGHGGSAVNLSLDQYATLACGIEQRLEGTVMPTWLLTAGPGEEAIADELCDRLAAEGLTTARLPSRRGLDDFALSLTAADLFIAGSTGPLHIAGCLDRPTAGFYPARRSATPLRWQTCNAPAHRLAFSPPDGASETDMSSIDLMAAAERIVQRLQIPTSSEPPS
ncbi:glycosyltransferase family 9 protein [Halomonas sp. M4R5S39]|uniref:glycosyltransferase family 9 protein n=1 Tax=Halomonas kalidii TaxID=3043293 RepID=UPI0024A8C456|nr:glycosyltransferase family 9 protein [Halomonas kalidii]MDI5987428.1 glycosyltransferase family 9 protein [Halomonas kalidii]